MPWSHPWIRGNRDASHCHRRLFQRCLLRCGPLSNGHQEHQCASRTLHKAYRRYRQQGQDIGAHRQLMRHVDHDVRSSSSATVGLRQHGLCMHHFRREPSGAAVTLRLSILLRTQAYDPPSPSSHLPVSVFLRRLRTRQGCSFEDTAHLRAFDAWSPEAGTVSKNPKFHRPGGTNSDTDQPTSRAARPIKNALPQPLPIRPSSHNQSTCTQGSPTFGLLCACDSYANAWLGERATASRGRACFPRRVCATCRARR
jgi:hypothetical protein